MAKNIVGETYNTLQGTVIQGDIEGFQQVVSERSGTSSAILMIGLCLLVIIVSILETGALFGFLMPSDLILSASIITFVILKKWWMVFVITILSICFTIIGDYMGYNIGKRLGSRLYDREDTRYFKKKYFLSAQEEFVRRGGNILYIGRYLAIGDFLPIIYGIMNWEKKDFIKVSVISSITWTLSMVIPIIILMLIFPVLQKRIGLLLILVFTLPEIIGWIVLLRPQAQEYFNRIVNAKEQIAKIRQDFSSMAQNVGELIQQVKNPDTNIGQVSDSQVPVTDQVSAHTTSLQVQTIQSVEAQSPTPVIPYEQKTSPSQ